MIFFVGLHQPHAAQHFDRAMISVNRLIRRKSDFQVNDWIKGEPICRTKTVDFDSGPNDERECT